MPRAAAARALRIQHRHHLAPHRQRGGGAGEARRAVVVVADPDDAEAVAGEARVPGIALLVGGAGFPAAAIPGAIQRCSSAAVPLRTTCCIAAVSR